MLVIVRVVGLARQHERAVSRERALARRGGALVSADSEDEVRAVALEAAEMLIGDAGEIRACSGTSAGLTLIAPAGDVPLSEGHRGAAGSCHRHAPGRSARCPSERTSLASRCSPRASRCSRSSRPPSGNGRRGLVRAPLSADRRRAAFADGQRRARTRSGDSDRAGTARAGRGSLRLARPQCERSDHRRRSRGPHRLPEPVDRPILGYAPEDVLDGRSPSCSLRRSRAARAAARVT